MIDINEIKSLFAKRLDETSQLVQLTNKTSVLVIQQFPIESDINTLLPKVRESIANILCFVELGDLNILKEIIEMSDGKVDSIVLDSDIKCSSSRDIIEYVSTKIQASKLFYYSDNNTWADSAIKFLLHINEGLLNKKIFLSGEGLLHDNVKRKLEDYCPKLLNENENENVDIIIGAMIKKESIDEDKLSLVSKQTKIYDVGIGNFSKKFINGAREKGASIYRIDIRAGISSVVMNILETDYLISNVMGEAKIKGVEMVAGGILGGEGAIVLDHINEPLYVIGVADGKGNFKNDLSRKDIDNIDFVERLISK
jgi:hypothetical protein